MFNQTLARNIPTESLPQAAAALQVERACCKLSNDDSRPKLSPPPVYLNVRARPSPISSLYLPLLCIYKAPRCAERHKRASSPERQSAERAFWGEHQPVQPPKESRGRVGVLFQLRCELGVPGELFFGCFNALPSFESIIGCLWKWLWSRDFFDEFCWTNFPYCAG